MTPDPSWLKKAPPELSEWMERFGGVSETVDPETLAEAALRALRAAAAQTGRNRDAAFALLAADGLLTRAVERLAEAEDPEAELLAVIDRIAAYGVGEET